MNSVMRCEVMCQNTGRVDAVLVLVSFPTRCLALPSMSLPLLRAGSGLAYQPLSEITGVTVVVRLETGTARS